MKSILRLLILCCVFALAGGDAAPAKEPFTLGTVREKVKRDYGQVTHMPIDSLVQRLAKREDVVLFDVREDDEFAVSRIAGALRVDPGIWRSTFMRRFSDSVRGKTVVFYCSVGVRSSKLAEAVQKQLKAQGALAVYNLDGGVFAWHNQSRPLVNGTGETPFVHPYDSHWGKLLDRRELLRTDPGS